MVGAHVAYRDLAGFGRRYVDESPDELKADVMYQIVEYGGLDGAHMTNVATVDGLEPDRYFKQVGQLTDCPRMSVVFESGAGDMRRDSAESRFDTPEHRLRFWCRAPFCGNIEPVRHNRGNDRKDSRKESRNNFLEPKEAP